MTPEQHKQVLQALFTGLSFCKISDGKAKREIIAAIAIMEAAPIIQNYPEKDSCRAAMTDADLNALHDKLGGRPVVATYNESKRKA